MVSTQTSPGAQFKLSGLRPSALRASDSVFDHPAALARLDGDEQFLCDMAELFVQDGPERLAIMETALTAEALLDVQRLAHNLRGSACHFMARAAVAAAHRLETASARGDLVLARKNLLELKREVELLLGRLRALVCSPVDSGGPAKHGDKKEMLS
jgi:HPt (histidine-containing phosphotransfer) domain-containing protein